MYQLSTLPVSVDPSTRLALSNLRAFLLVEGDYSTEAINAIVAHIAREGCFDSDAPYLLYPGDLAAAEAAYVRGFEEVPYDSPEWGHLDDVEPFSADAPDARHAASDAYWAGLAELGISRLPAIAGGCDDDIPPPYEPTPEDWEEYRRVFDEEDAELIGTDAMRAWYATHPLSEFNAQRVD
jgi:hypothetical protein